MIIPCVFGLLIHGSREHRNFKTNASDSDMENLLQDCSKGLMASSTTDQSRDDFRLASSVD